MKVAVIGAGPAGLSAALELKHLGVEVHTYEAHSKSGGCASYFKRKFNDPKAPELTHTALFDAGATVLWSMCEGDFFSKQLHKWGLSNLTFERHSSHYYSFNDNSFVLDSYSEEAWTSSLIKNFPEDQKFIQAHFKNFFSVAHLLNKVLYSLPHEPFLEAKNISKNLNQLPSLLRLAPLTLRYPRKFSDLIQHCSSSFKQWAESMLLITLQARSHEVESLYGMTALCFYPLGAGSLKGGMASLFQQMAHLANHENSKLYLACPIKKIHRSGAYIVESEKHGHQKYEAILLSTPRWNSQSFFQDQLFSDPTSFEWSNIKDNLWSAVVGYFVFEDHPSLPQGSFNHLVKSNEDEFYFSVSSRDAIERAPLGFRVATVSTHEKLNEWEYPHYIKKKPFTEREIYEKQKSSWARKMLLASEKVFSTKALFVEIATPKTFLAYTHRKEGFVGGIPLSSKYSLFSSPSQNTLLPNVYQIGDTAFPGQSIVNCCAGALMALQKLGLKP